MITMITTMHKIIRPVISPLACFKLFKLISVISLVTLLSGCSSSVPSTDLSLSKWSTEQLVTKGRAEFENSNYSNASKYLKEASNRDNPEALYALGYMHYYGHGITRDPDMAQDLIRRAAAFGHKPAIKALRLFIANKSIFTVDTETSTYLADSAVNPTDTPKTNNIKPAPITAKINNTNASNKLSANLSAQVKTIETITPIAALPNFEHQNNKISEPKTAPNITPNITKTPSIKANNINITTIENEPAPAQPTQAKLSLEPTLAPLDNSWLKKQNPNDYTVQITSKKTLSELQEFITTNNLNNKAHIFGYVYKNETWYGAGIGVYQKPSEAYNAMLNAPIGIIGIKATKPWVRQFKNIEAMG